MINLESAILIIGIVQGLFLAGTLSTKTASSLKPNRYLILLLLTFVVALTVQWLSLSASSLALMQIMAVGSSVVFLFGPLLYFYVKSLVSPQSPFKHFGVLHFIPWFAYLLLVIYLALFSAEQFEIANDISLSRQSYTSLLLPFLKLFHVVFYTAFCLVLLLRYKRRIENNFSNIDNINLFWLRNLVIGFILFECAIAVAIALNISASILPANADTLLSFILIILIFMTGFYGMRQPAITEKVLTLNDQEPIPVKQHKAQQKVSIKNLNAIEIETITERLNELTLQNIHLDRFINLTNLSELVGVSQHKMSEYLNSQLGITFYEYINRSRINDAKYRLINSEDSVLDIALQVGFNNKATFNKAFKQFENITPSEFRRQNNVTDR